MTKMSSVGAVETAATAMPAPSQIPPLTAHEFARIQRLAYENFGLCLKEGKQNLVIARLARELRRLRLRSFDEYLAYVESDPSGEAMSDLANALTTNFTSFMREPVHFEFLRTEFVSRMPQPRGRIGIWCAACSTGEEAYSILFTLLEVLGTGADVHVMATDISTRALRVASEGVYEAEGLQTLPQGWPQKYFLRGKGSREGLYRVKPEFRERVHFARFNLITSRLPATSFPAIFCRNVAIYFDKPTQSAVVQRLGSVLLPGGYLFIGHSESLTGIDHEFEYVKPALYRKVGKSVS